MVQSILKVLGGVAIFIYGMTLMSDGLQKVAGSKMRSILRLFAKNRFVAVLTGVGVTSVIQSSAATTVMVVGFVNAGLLNLEQAIGIICGAHIGTTVTGQLVAFNISAVIFPSIILGLIMFISKKRSITHWGEVIMGFGFLFLGMEMMNGTLQELEFIKSALQYFQCAPVDGIMPPLAVFGAILVGMLVTVVIQSSSACTGLIIVLANNDMLDFYTAVALALGSNIGTTITAQLAAISANRVAKQAAMAHTLTQALGVLLIAVTFWMRVKGEPFFFWFIRLCSPGAELPRLIANSHTIFNVFSTIVFLPFIPQLARLCEKIIPVNRKDVKFRRLDPLLLSTPSIALAQTTAALRKMLQKSWRMVDCAINIYNHNDESNQRIVKQLEKREEDVDQRQQEISDYLSSLMQQGELTSNEAGQIPLLLHCANDAERIGDHTVIIQNIISRLEEQGRRFSGKADEELDALHQQLGKLAEAVIHTLEKNTPENVAHAKELRHEMVEALTACEREHLNRINSGLCVPQVGIIYLELLEEIRKIGRHMANIADRAESLYEKPAKLGKVELPSIGIQGETQSFE
jgi:phosphate:Na+ symporter